MIGEHEILQKYNKSEEIPTVYPLFFWGKFCSLSFTIFDEPVLFWATPFCCWQLVRMGKVLKCNLFLYPQIRMALYWRDTTQKNLLPSHIYSAVSKLTCATVRPSSVLSLVNTLFISCCSRIKATAICSLRSGNCWLGLPDDPSLSRPPEPPTADIRCWRLAPEWARRGTAPTVQIAWVWDDN